MRMSAIFRTTIINLVTQKVCMILIFEIHDMDTEKCDGSL